MTRGERPMLRDSNILFAAGLLALCSLAVGVLVGVLRIERPRDLLLNVSYSPWVLLPVGLALLASAIILGDALLTRAWVPEMTGVLAVATLGAAACFSPALFALAVLLALVVGRVRNPRR